MRIRAMKKQSQNEPNTNPIKPNFRKAKMKLNFYSTKDYENKPRLRAPGKQTQSNPISAQKARAFANSLPLFTHFYQFFTKFFLPILPKPANRKINKLTLRPLHLSAKLGILLNEKFNALNDLAK